MGFLFLLYAGVRVGSFRSPLEIKLMYLFGGACGGGIVGVLLPLARSRVGAAALGILAMIPFLTFLGMLDASVSGDDAIPLMYYELSAVLVGGLAGYVIRDTYHRDLDEQRE